VQTQTADRKGAADKGTEKLLNTLEGCGDKDPLDYLNDVVTNGQDPELRIQAANYLLPYKHSKRSAAVEPRYIAQPVAVPHFTAIEEAEAYLASLPVLLGGGELDSQAALELPTLTKNWIDARYAREELQLKLLTQGGGPDQTIHIEGGLPALPGTNFIVDDTAAGRVNGMNGRGPVIDHQPTDSIPRSEAQEP
jgi:hypothetical protein